MASEVLVGRGTLGDILLRAAVYLTWTGILDGDLGVGAARFRKIYRLRSFPSFSSAL